MKTAELELLTIQDVVNLFQVKESKIRRLIFRKEIPYLKLGALIRFKKDHLDIWLSRNLVSPKKPLI